MAPAAAHHPRARRGGGPTSTWARHHAQATQKNISAPSGWKKRPTLSVKIGERFSRSAAQNPAHAPKSRRPSRNRSQVVPAKSAMKGARSRRRLGSPPSAKLRLAIRIDSGG